MLKSLDKALSGANTPLHRVKSLLSRYVLVSCCTGSVGFVAAFLLLRAGVSEFITLIISACVSGALNYLAMEHCTFRHREGCGELSWKRLAQNSLVGAGGFGARYATLLAALRYLQLPSPFQHLVSLALAYLVSFVIGYTLRSRIVFK